MRCHLISIMHNYMPMNCKQNEDGLGDFVSEEPCIRYE